MARVVFALGLAAANAVELREASQAAANPIRKVVTMLQNIQKKVAAEGEKEEEMFEKYMCYCKTGAGDLEKSIAAADTKIAEVSSAVEEAAAKKQQLDADLVAHKADREAAKAAMAEATSLREKEAAEFAKVKGDGNENYAAIEKAVAALEKGVAGSFLQSSAANVVRKLAVSLDMGDADRQEVMAFLQSDSEYSPQSGEIIGILKQMGDEMAAGVAEATAAEEAAIENYDALMAAKKKEVASLTKSIETKSTRVGELAVSVAEMTNDADDTAESLADDKKFLADLAANCETKTAEWEEVKKTRAEETLALADTIKILNDDDALELFKKTLPSAASSFVQVQVSKTAIRARALSMIRAAQHSSKPVRQQLDFISLALNGKAIGFEKIIKMIDELVVLLEKEQGDDDKKKDDCNSEFDIQDDKKKGLETSISDSDKAIADAEETIATLKSEIEALEDGIKALDKSVAEATEQRKEQNEEFKELMASDSAAKDVLAFAKNRLNKFYNPKLYVAPPKRELSEEDKITTAFGGTAAPTPAPGGIAGTGIEFAQIRAHAQADGQVAPPPPPEAVPAYKTKTEENNGVIAMMDLLIKDLEKEMTTAEADEKNAQAEYEQTMEDSAAKRAADSKSMTEKSAAKADTEAALETHKDDKTSDTKMLASVMETISALHADCDWLIQYFDARKAARAGEVESLKNAKSVLSGADYSLLQTRTRSLRGRN